MSWDLGPRHQIHLDQAGGAWPGASAPASATPEGPAALLPLLLMAAFTALVAITVTGSLPPGVWRTMVGCS